MSDPAQPIPPKPQEGTVAPVEVRSAWKHPLIILSSIAAAIPLILAALIQLQEIPGLPTNVMAWIASGITILTLISTVLRQLGFLGKPSVSPTAAAKLIQTDVPEKQ